MLSCIYKVYTQTQISFLYVIVTFLYIREKIFISTQNLKLNCFYIIVEVRKGSTMPQQIGTNLPYRVDYRQNTNPAMQGQQGNPVMRTMTEGNENPEGQLKTFALVPPMMLALYKTMEGFAKINSGAYDKSLSGRLANLGDKLAESTVGKPLGKVFNKIGGLWDKLVNRSKILTALTKMPSMPENTFAKGLLHGTNKQLGDEFITFVNKYLKKGGNLADLAGLTQADFDRIQKLVGSDASSEVKKGLQEILKICDTAHKQKSYT